MLRFAAAVCLVAGAILLAQTLRSDRAVRRWTHTRGRIVSASRSHLDDAGREVWQVEVSWRDAAGQDHSRSVRQHGNRVDARRGEAVDVWFDPRRPDRAEARLEENAAGGSWLGYALGGVLLLAGAAVLLVSLR